MVKARVGTRTPQEGDPACVAGGLAAPARHHHQAAGDGEGNNAQDDEEQRRDPLRRQLRGGTVALSAVDGVALAEQAHGQRAWVETEKVDSVICPHPCGKPGTPRRGGTDCRGSEERSRAGTTRRREAPTCTRSSLTESLAVNSCIRIQDIS